MDEVDNEIKTVKESLEEYCQGIKVSVKAGLPYSKKDPTGYFIRQALKRVIKDFTIPKELK
jgi:hypothetical protein